MLVMSGDWLWTPGAGSRPGVDDGWGSERKDRIDMVPVLMG